MRENMQYLYFLVCFILVNMLISSSIHFSINDLISYFIIAEYYSIVCIYHIFLIHSSVDEYLGWSITGLLWIVLQ
jgi:predicted Kef-type K+ transport protein